MTKFPNDILCPACHWRIPIRLFLSTYFSFIGSKRTSKKAQQSQLNGQQNKPRKLLNTTARRTLSDVYHSQYEEYKASRIAATGAERTSAHEYIKAAQRQTHEG